jgi:low temperature requirement protein LtrA
LRITVWFLASGVFWLAGAAAGEDARLWLWVVALAIEYVGPSAGYWSPGLGRSNVADWNVEGAHLAERCGLFIIIALGESLLITGATFSGLAWTPALVTAMVASFGAAVAMWWVYFDETAEAGSELIAHAEVPGRLARLAYTYIHLPMVAGIVLTAVGDEFVLAHPTGDTPLKVALVILGGPMLFLLGHWLFKRAVFGRWAMPHVAGIAILGASIAAYERASPVTLSAVATVALLIVAGWLVVLHRRHPLAH